MKLLFRRSRPVDWERTYKYENKRTENGMKREGGRLSKVIAVLMIILLKLTYEPKLHRCPIASNSVTLSETATFFKNLL